MAIIGIQRQSISWLIAEFVVVVLGVGAALAADSWREGFQEQQLESEYIVRLGEDLIAGYSALEYQQGEAERAYEAASMMIEILETSIGHETENELVDLFILAARYAETPDQLDHDITFQELIATGRLNLIRDANIRYSLAEYYRRLEQLTTIRGRVPRTILVKFQETTGVTPWSVDSWQEIPEVRRRKIQSELLENPESIAELLRYRSSLWPLIYGLGRNTGRTGRQLRTNLELQEMLNGN